MLVRFFEDPSQALVAKVIEALNFGDSVELHNPHDTFYGSSWYGDLLKVFPKNYSFVVLDTWDAFGYCSPFPSVVSVRKN